ncbi:hypothetical protein ABZ529_35365, partial [Nocardia sp. NPDC019302]
MSADARAAYRQGKEPELTTPGRDGAPLFVLDELVRMLDKQRARMGVTTETDTVDRAGSRSQHGAPGPAPRAGAHDDGPDAHRGSPKFSRTNPNSTPAGDNEDIPNPLGSGHITGENQPAAPEGSAPPEDESLVQQLLASVDPGLLESVRESVAAERDAAILHTGVAADSADVARFRRLDDMLGHLDELRAVHGRMEESGATEIDVAPDRFRWLVHHFHAAAERWAALEQLAAVDRYRAADERVEQVLVA